MQNDSSGTKISIIIPAFNEAGTIEHTLRDIHTYVSSAGLVSEIIVINDGSTDQTKEILEQIPYIILINHKVNRGYSASLKTGIAKAQYGWILTIDADGSHVANQIKELTAYTPDYDLIVGSRDGKLGYDTLFRKIGRRIVSRFAEYISQSKILDINSGFRLFKKELAHKFWHLFPEGFSFSTTLTVASHVRHYAVKYVFVEVHKRKGGSSTIKPAKDFIGFLNLIVRLAIYFRPLRVFIPLSIFLFTAAIIVGLLSYIFLSGVLDTTMAIFITAGMQTLIFGLIAEMIVKRFYND